MAGVRRRLRDVGATITGVLGEVLGGRAADDEQEAGTGVPDTGGVPTAAAETDAPADAVVADEPRAAAPDEVSSDPSTADDETVGGAAADAAPDADVEPDALLVAAVDRARAAAVEEGGRRVGEHLGAAAEGDPLVVTHAFATLDPAYVGWTWAVTLARAPGRDVVTVDEVVLLPGAGALLAPAWVPYAERVRPGDLGTGDLLPPAPDDARLVPAGYDPDWVFDDLVWELGLGRARVLSVEGRADAALRWLDGETGPRSPRAKAAPGRCGDCGFLVPLGGALRAAFGACANALAPDDGRVVALDHGCGAHSEQPVEPAHAPAPPRVAQESEYEVEPAGPATRAADPLPGPADEEQAEELGHS